MVAPHYGKLGFVPDGDRWALELDTSTT